MSFANKIIYGSKAQVETYIQQYQPDINELDEYGYTPLIEAAISDKPDVAFLLIQHGADVNKADMTGRTALHWAVENSNVELTQTLLQQGANPNVYNLGSQPPLVMPLVRKKNKLKKLLLAHGADLNFAKDYINTKMLSHIYNLQGIVHIVNHEGTFIELSLEGYFLEYTLYAIHEALSSFLTHYGAKPMRRYFGYLRPILLTINNAAELLKLQQYNTNREPHEKRIQEMLSRDLLLLPVAYEGHAISYIKFDSIWIHCDRGEYGREHGCINIYRIGNLAAANAELFYHLLYTKVDKHFLHQELPKILELQHIEQIPIAEQVTGNCSWANIETSIPCMLYLLFCYQDTFPQLTDNEIKTKALDIYQFWLEWLQNRELNRCIQDFEEASPARKASKAALLGAILLQQCHYDDLRNIEQVNKIISVLMHPSYQYVLSSYLKGYCAPSLTPGGKNLRDLLESCGVDPDKLI